jgi:hypothetical protein
MLTMDDLKDLREAVWRVFHRASYDPANVSSETLFLAQQMEALLDEHEKLRKVAEAADALKIVETPEGPVIESGILDFDAALAAWRAP